MFGFIGEKELIRRMDERIKDSQLDGSHMHIYEYTFYPEDKNCVSYIKATCKRCGLSKRINIPLIKANGLKDIFDAMFVNLL